MAQGIRLVCENCGKSIETWDDGNLYYLEPGIPIRSSGVASETTHRIFVLTAARSSWPIQERRMSIVSTADQSWTRLIWPGIDVLSAGLGFSLAIRTSFACPDIPAGRKFDGRPGAVKRVPARCLVRRENPRRFRSGLSSGRAAVGQLQGRRDAQEDA